MKTINWMIALMLLVSSAAYAQQIDKDASIVNFEVSNMKVRTVTGTFSGMEGKISFDQDKPNEAFFSVCIDAASVNTDNEKRDDHLRNEDFFDVEVYPQICFTSTSTVKTNSGFTTKGILKMHGVEREESIDFTFDGNRFVGALQVNRLLYKVGENINTTMVGDLITLEIIAAIK